MLVTDPVTSGFRRRDLLKTSAVVVGFSFTGLPQAQTTAALGAPRLDLTELDAFLAIRKDG